MAKFQITIEDKEDGEGLHIVGQFDPPFSVSALEDPERLTQAQQAGIRILSLFESNEPNQESEDPDEIV